MKLDPAVIELLKLDPAHTTVSSAGGGGCSSASTAKVTSQLADGSTKTFFMKTATGDEAKVMFEGEHTSLHSIHRIVPTLCPESFGHGTFTSSPSTSFLVTDFLTITSSRPSSGPSLASKLAKLHTTPAPTPPGHTHPVFGFPVTTCCGDTPQDNSYKASWSDFYANNRLRSILRQAETRNGRDASLRQLVDTTASTIVPRLLGAGHLGGKQGITPVVVHGDLWSGNAGRGTLAGGSEVQEVVFDSSACYAHSEYEIGIMRMFGGFGAAFFEEYHRGCPKTEPVGEYEDRVELYALYHYLNHYALFGGGYKASAASIMKKLLKKYGAK